MSNIKYTIELRDRVTRIANKMQKSLNRVQMSAEKAANSIDNIGVVAGAVAIGGIFKLGAELEKTTIFFQTLTGSVEKGNKLFKELTQFANTTPFSNQAINKNAQVMLAFGQKSEKVIDTLSMLGDVAGGDQEKLRLITLAFSQIQAAGRLMGQDLLQLINAGFNPLQIISQKTGMSMLELKKAMEKGLISSELVAKTFEMATSEGGRFFKLTEKMGKSMSGRWSTAMGKAKFIVSEFGLSMKGIFLPFIDGAIKTIEKLSKFKKTLFPVLKAITIFTTLVLSLTLALKGLVVVMKLVNVLLLSNPVTLAITVFAGLVAVFVTMYQKSEKFRESFHKIIEVFRIFSRGVKNAIKPAIESIKKSFDRLKKSLEPVIDKIKEMKINFDFILNAIKKTVGVITFIFLTGFNIIAKIIEKIFDTITLLSKGISSIANIDLKNLGNSIDNIGKKIVNVVLKRFEKAIKIIQLLNSVLSENIGSEKFKKSLSELGDAIKDAFSTPFGVNLKNIDAQTESIINNLSKKSKKIAQDIKEIIEGAGKDTKGKIDFDFNLNDSPEIRNLKAQGIVSGGRINTFNVNIQSLTGIDTVTTENIETSAEQAGEFVKKALLKGLADIKTI